MMLSEGTNTEQPDGLQGRRVALVGRFASMPKREAARLVRSHGAVVVEKPGPSVELIVIGEEGLPLPEGGSLDDWFAEALEEPALRRAVDDGSIEVVGESHFWQRLGMVEDEPDIHRLYTPAMLAELLKIPVAVIRRWHRRGLIVPVRQVRKLPYFDFREVATARRMAELLTAGVSPRTIEKKLAALARYLPSVERPLTQLSVIIEGKQILLRQGDGLVEPGGQLHFDFGAFGEKETADEPASEPSGDLRSDTSQGPVGLPASPQEMERMAAELEEAGQLEAAAEMYHAVMAAHGATPEACFQLGELLYRLGDLNGARERYYMAIELDEDFVEARANLGCVLAETGQADLAEAAFQGALAYHGDYADVHCHLARLLDESGRRQEAEKHWRTFLELAPDSPWAEQAHTRLGENG